LISLSINFWYKTTAVQPLQQPQNRPFFCRKHPKRSKQQNENRLVELRIKKGWIEILPRFKIQYPMKNQGKDGREEANLQAWKYVKSATKHSSKMQGWKPSPGFDTYFIKTGK
jgi:hypothetical protein